MFLDCFQYCCIYAHCLLFILVIMWCFCYYYCCEADVLYTVTSFKLFVLCIFTAVIAWHFLDAAVCIRIMSLFCCIESLVDIVGCVGCGELPNNSKHKILDIIKPCLWKMLFIWCYNWWLYFMVIHFFFFAGLFCFWYSSSVCTYIY